MELLRTLTRLGWGNVVRVAFYRAQLRSGWFARALPVADWPTAFDERWFFRREMQAPRKSETILLFGTFEVPIETTPDWSTNLINGVSIADTDAHWSRMSDFGEAVGDIKCVWEPSRFDWALKLAWRARAGQSDALITLEHWLRSWCEQNAPNTGANWKCGQEASIRVMHMLFLCDLLEDLVDQNDVAIIGFLQAHLERILPSLHYAKGQSNNHATSEAVALYCGGAFLRQAVSGDETLIQRASHFELQGRRALEQSVSDLIMTDGTFAQYSSVYHRLMLDTVVFAELRRRRTGGTLFSNQLYRRMTAAVHWLEDLLDPISGDVPNIGSNDGAHLFNAAGLPYRNFAAGLDVAAQTFTGSGTPREVDADVHAFASVYDRELMQGAPHAPAEQSESPATGTSLEGGFAVLTREAGRCVFRLPGYRFRPGQCDAHHVDVWHKGSNVLRDAGTYSYNTDGARMEYYPSVAAHNTVQFDDAPQMPSRSRFLYTHWLKREHLSVKRLSDGGGCITSRYTSLDGNRHTRSVESNDKGWIVTDTLEGSFASATLYWHLAPLNWAELADGVESSLCLIRVHGGPVTRTMTAASESTHYLRESSVPVLECSVKGQSTVVTHIEMC